MTTIIWAGRKIVADTQGNMGSFISPRRSSKIKTVGQYVVAVSGDAMSGSRLIRKLTEHLNNGTMHDAIFEPNPAHKDTFTVLIVHRTTGDAFVWYGNFETWDYMAPPYTMGSGGKIALGAHLAGASLENAVKIAASQDTGTNDVIDIIEWDEKGSVRHNGVHVITGEVVDVEVAEYAQIRERIFNVLSVQEGVPTAHSWDSHDTAPHQMNMELYWPAGEDVLSNDIIYGENFAVVISKYNDPLAAACDMGMLSEKYGKGVCVTSRPSPHYAYVGVRTSRQLADQIMAACEWHKTDNRLNVEYRRP